MNTKESNSTEMDDRIARATRYVSKIEAISGERGHDATFSTAIALIHGFSLPIDKAREILAAWNETNTGGVKWTRKELDHKLEDAASVEPLKGKDWLWKKGPISRSRSGSANSDQLPKPPENAFRTTLSNIQRRPKKVAEPVFSNRPKSLASVSPKRATSKKEPPPSDLRGAADDRAPAPQLAKAGDSAPERLTASPGNVRLLADLRGAEEIALDLETYGPPKKWKKGKEGALDPFRGDIRLLTLQRRDSSIIWTVDLKEGGYNLGELGEIIEGASIVAHNAKFDLLWLKVKCGISPAKIFDTMSASLLLAAGDSTPRGFNSLDGCLERRLGIVPGDFEGGKSDWSSDLTDEQTNYATRDVAHLFDLADAFEADIEATGLIWAWELEMSLLPVVVDMEFKGIGVSGEKLERYHQQSLADAAKAEEAAKRSLGKPDINLNSPKQLKDALHEIGVGVESTNVETLTGRVDDHPAIRQILDFREVNKQAQQAETLLNYMADDGRIHCHLNPSGTVTGRFSSSEPNLQNVKRGELRESLVPAAGYRFVRADYSQIELRTVAAITGEGKMLEAYERNQDLHALTASLILNKPVEEVTEEERRTAKATNFGLIYGQSARGLVKYARVQFGVELTLEEAAEFRRAFFQAYPKIKSWHDEMGQAANGEIIEVRTLMGRRRLIPEDATWWEKFSRSVNTPIQGAAADGMKAAMVPIAKEFPSKLILQIHDEVILEVPEGEADETLGRVIRIMEKEMGKILIGVPIVAEGKVADSYGGK